MGIYDVAVWMYWSTEVLPSTEELEATSPLEAVVVVMQMYGLERVEHVAVKLPDGSFLRWEEGMTLSDEEKVMPSSEGREGGVWQAVRGKRRKVGP